MSISFPLPPPPSCLIAHEYNLGREGVLVVLCPAGNMRVYVYARETSWVIPDGLYPRQEAGYCPIRDSSRAIEWLPTRIYWRLHARSSPILARRCSLYIDLEFVVVSLKWTPVIVSENFYRKVFLEPLGQFPMGAVEISP